MTPDLNELKALCAQVDALVKECSFDYLSDEKLREVLARRADHQFKLRRAEALLTAGLARFPLHPCLLERRGDVRQLISDENGAYPALEGAESDYLLADEVTYSWPRYERAMLHYVHGDDMAAVANEFSELARTAEARLCRSIAGRVKALHDADLSDAARADLDKWRAVFPDDAELAEAARWIGR